MTTVPEGSPRADLAKPYEAQGQVLAAATGWLERNLPWFDPEQWARHLPTRGFPPSALLELLIASRLLRRAGVPGGAGLHQAAAELAQQVANRPSFAASLLKGDRTLGHYIWLLALMRDAGQPDHGLLAAGERLIEAGDDEMSNPGQSAAATLERRYILGLAGIEHRRPASGALYQRTAMGLGADPLRVTDADAYVITHMLYYLTDFGAVRLRLGTGERHRIRELTDVLLGRYLATGDLDLSAELLGCAELVGLASPRLTATGWRRLARVLRPDGSVPGPLHQPVRAATLTGDKARAYEFGTCYHTTIAAVISGAIAADDHD